jgi:peptide/nickel transport system permease protein
VVTLALGYVGQFVIVMRSSMLEVKEAPYVEVARAKGLSERGVRRGHVVPNAFLPSFTLIVLSVGFILGGAIVIETVFSWPGLGLLTYQAIQDQDYPVLEAVFLLSSAAVVLANLVADLAYGYLDPRIDEV